MIFLQALSLTQMRHLFFQTSTDSSSLFKESMWITSPPHRSVSYSPWCLFFLFFFWGWVGVLCLLVHVEGLILHVASACNLIFVFFFFSETQSSKPAAAVAASRKGSCKNQDSKTGENTTSSCSHTTETLHAPACVFPPPCSINSEKRKFCFICLHFFLCFLRMIYKTREAHAKQFMQRWWRSQQWVCQIEEGFVFSTRDKKKKLWKKRERYKQFLHLPFHCTHCYARLWNLSLQQTRN